MIEPEIIDLEKYIMGDIPLIVYCPLCENATETEDYIEPNVIHLGRIYRCYHDCDNCDVELSVNYRFV
jgi:hypothetical protein